MSALLIRSAAVLAAVLLLVGAHAAPLESQTESRVTVQTEPGTPIVAVAVWISTTMEPADADPRIGLAALSARTIFAPVHERLDRQGGHLALDIRPDGILFTLLSAPDHWEVAVRELGVALFRDPPLDDVVRRERERLINEVRSRDPNPAVQATLATNRILYGEDHPWAHPPLGFATTLADITADEVDAFLRGVFRPERTRFAVVGPVAKNEVENVLGPFLSASPPPVAPTPAAPDPGVHEIEYPTITTWVTLVWTLPPDSDLPAAEVLAGAVADALAFGPRSRSVYNARAWMVRRPGRAELRVEVVVPPAEAELWAGRVRQVVQDHANAPLTPGEASRLLRRQRGRVALATVRPEDRARAAVEHQMVPVAPELLSPVTAERLRAAADSLADPLVVKLGPFRSAIGED